MKFHRVYAIVLRHLFQFRHSYDRLTDSFYWPILDLVLWGITSSYYKSYIPKSNIVLIIVWAIMLWIIVWRGQYEITVNVLEDLWDKNLVNIFAAPLKFSEWISSLLILGIIKTLLSFSFGIVIAYILYKINVFAYGLYLIPFALLLIMTGWWMGFIISGLILRFGTKIQTFAWTAPWIFVPFSAIYYPLSVLPAWAQKISYLVPTSYVFEQARNVINTGAVDMNKLYISFTLNVLYLILGIVFIKSSFKKAKNNGLIKLN